VGCGLDLLRDREVSSLLRIFFLVTAISVLAIPARSGHSNPRLGCDVFVLLSRSMFRSLPFRSLNAARSPRSHSLEGFSPTLLEQFPLQQPGLCCPSPVSRPPCRTRAARPLYVRVSLRYPALIKPPLPEFPRFNDIGSPACLSLGQARRDACCDQEWDGMP